MKYKQILFDLDGTLTDSGPGIMRGAKYALNRLGIPIPPEDELRTIVGPPLGGSFAKFGVPENLIDEAIRLYRVDYNDGGGKFINTVYAGIPELLQQLKASGYRLFVATAKPEMLARDVLENNGLSQYFEYIAGASFDHSRESKAAVLRYLLEMFGGSGEAVLIGDTEYDVAGAKELSIPCIGVSWGYGTVDSMRAAGAEAIIGSPEQLPEYLL